MHFPISFYIGLRYSRAKSRSGFISFITFFSIVGILLGVASLIVVASVMNGFEGELKQRVLGIVPHVVVEADEDWQTQSEKLKALNHVADVTPFSSAEVIIQSSKGLQGVLAYGVVPEKEQGNIVSANIFAGDMQYLARQKYGVVIGEPLARKLGVHLGDDVRIVLPNKTVFTPMGRVPVQRTFSIVGIFNLGSQIDDSVIYLNSKDLAKMHRKKGDGISDLRLYLSDAFKATDVAQSVAAAFPDKHIDTWQRSQGALFSAVNMEKNMMTIMLSLIVAVAAFNIVSALVMVVIEKQGEIGILQTLGMNRRQIMGIFITQGVVNGVWGTLIGAIVGIALALNLNEFMQFIGIANLALGSQLLPVDMQWNNIAVIVLGAVVMSFLATLYPAYRAAKTQPAEVLRNE
ncbi:lipoprotein-releasing ABC transporter permease subunit [Thalassotalea agarivorans]|uniref:Lipoprotein-releasing system permease protein n=1 Tax=Thalassotalea agarivorans TaxID=349064 RepID=A0A1I0FCM5_THASX|nr:lipoprotein-releasing ABC transporter permease subunit [Thalassotalea agarivorans]SET55279.1 lipoprotein-releasing system permease protein [Thalassotalea agarivorans]